MTGRPEAHRVGPSGALSQVHYHMYFIFTAIFTEMYRFHMIYRLKLYVVQLVCASNGSRYRRCPVGVNESRRKDGGHKRYP